MVLKFPTVFTQTLKDMCADIEMIHLYEYFVLCGTILLSSYWEQATNNNIDEFDSVKTPGKRVLLPK